MCICQRPRLSYSRQKYHFGLTTGTGFCLRKAEWPPEGGRETARGEGAASEALCIVERLWCASSVFDNWEKMLIFILYTFKRKPTSFHLDLKR